MDQQPVYQEEQEEIHDVYDNQHLSLIIDPIKFTFKNDQYIEKMHNKNASIFNLFKARSGLYPGNAEDLTNDQVIKNLQKLKTHAYQKRMRNDPQCPDLQLKQLKFQREMTEFEQQDDINYTNVKKPRMSIVKQLKQLMKHNYQIKKNNPNEQTNKRPSVILQGSYMDLSSGLQGQISKSPPKKQLLKNILNKHKNNIVNNNKPPSTRNQNKTQQNFLQVKEQKNFNFSQDNFFDDGDLIENVEDSLSIDNSAGDYKKKRQKSQIELKYMQNYKNLQTKKPLNLEKAKVFNKKIILYKNSRSTPQAQSSGNLLEYQKNISPLKIQRYKQTHSNLRNIKNNNNQIKGEYYFKSEDFSPPYRSEKHNSYISQNREKIFNFSLPKIRKLENNTINILDQKSLINNKSSSNLQIQTESDINSSQNQNVQAESIVIKGNIMDQKTSPTKQRNLIQRTFGFNNYANIYYTEKTTANTTSQNFNILKSTNTPLSTINQQQQKQPYFSLKSTDNNKNNLQTNTGKSSNKVQFQDLKNALQELTLKKQQYKQQLYNY